MVKTGARDDIVKTSCFQLQTTDVSNLECQVPKILSWVGLRRLLNRLSPGVDSENETRRSLSGDLSGELTGSASNVQDPSAV